MGKFQSSKIISKRYLGKYFYNTKVMNYLKANNVTYIKGTVSIDDRLPNSWTALHLAVEENKIKMAKFLIDNGADIEGKIIIKDYKYTCGYACGFIFFDLLFKVKLCNLKRKDNACGGFLLSPLLIW